MMNEQAWRVKEKKIAYRNEVMSGRKRVEREVDSSHEAKEKELLTEGLSQTLFSTLGTLLLLIALYSLDIMVCI